MFADFYDDDSDKSQFYQGDILRNVPFPSWVVENPEAQSERWPILRPLRSGRFPERTPAIFTLPTQLEARANSDVIDSFAGGSEMVLGRCTLRYVMVISRGCQLDNLRRKRLLVAPVGLIHELPQAERGQDKLAALRAGEIPQSFYLPEQNDRPEAFADLLMISPLHRSFLNDPQNQIVARMSSGSMSALQQALARHFGTILGFDHMDRVPQTAFYRCSKCFYAGRAVPVLIVNKVFFLAHATYVEKKLLT